MAKKQLLSPRKQVTKQIESLTSSPENLYWISSGCSLLNLALSGDIDCGYPIGRIINIFGSASSAKSLLAQELALSAYFIEGKKKGKKVKVVYDDSEHALDIDLAIAFGLPMDEIDLIHSRTVEEFHSILWKKIDEYKNYDLLIFIEDSLDALSDESELKKIKKSIETGEQDGDYGAKKAKLLSQFFRTTAGDIQNTNSILFTISQTRDKLKGYGGTTTSGGNAVKFYSSQRIELVNLKEIRHKDIVQGMELEAKVRKNKVGKPRREVKFDLYFEYGIDDIGTMISFLAKNKIIENPTGYYVWENKRHRKQDLILLFEKSPKEIYKLKELTQETWDKLESESEFVRAPKWKLIESL